MNLPLEDEYLTVAEAAKLLKVSVSTIWRWIDQERLPAYRIGPRRVRIRKGDLVQLITPARTEQEPEPLSPAEQLGIHPMTAEERERALAAMEDMRRLRDEMLARRGGKPFPPAYIIINEMRDERTRDLERRGDPE